MVEKDASVVQDDAAPAAKLSKRQKKNLKKKNAKNVDSVNVDQAKEQTRLCIRKDCTSTNAASFREGRTNEASDIPPAKRHCNMNLPMTRWTDLSASEAAIALVLHLSLRNEADAFSYLERAILILEDQLNTSAVFGAALVHCADRGFLPCVQLLLCCEAPLDGGGTRMLYGGSLKGAIRTPLELAARRGHVEICRELLEARADVGNSRKAAESLRQYGEMFAKERSELLSLLDKY